MEWVRGGVGAERTMVFLFKFVRSTRARAHEMRRSWRMLMRRFDVMTEHFQMVFASVNQKFDTVWRSQSTYVVGMLIKR